jgi:hypothetical protein
MKNPVDKDWDIFCLAKSWCRFAFALISVIYLTFSGGNPLMHEHALVVCCADEVGYFGPI